MPEDQAEGFLKSFFVSYASADRIWAEWIRWQLEEHGYTTLLPNAGLSSEKNFALEIDTIFKEAERVLVILSPDYLRALYGQLEWAMILKQETTREQRLVLPVVVRECKQGLKSLGLGSISFLDLTGQEEATAQKMLLSEVRLESNKPRVLKDLAEPFEDQDLRATLKQQLRIFRQRSRVDNFQAGESAIEESLPLPLLYMLSARNPLFTDREDIFRLLEDAFEEGKPVFQPQALVGLGGIGKTQIALEYAYRHKDEYQYIFWIQADSKNSLITHFQTLAGKLNLEVEHLPDSAGVFKRWLQLHTDWLLIYDGANDLEILSEYMPSEPKGHILLTTRAQAVGMFAQSVLVGTLNKEDGAYFLLRRINKISRSAPFDTAALTDRRLAEEISCKLDGLPLALDQVGAYIEKTESSMAEYLSIYAAQRDRLLEPTSMYSESVYEVWSFSFEKIDQTHPASADLLRLCAFLAPDNIPEEIITQGAVYLGPTLASIATDPFKLHAAIEELRKFSFLSRDAKQKTLSVHSLVQEMLREKMEPGVRLMWATRAVLAVNAVFPQVEVDRWRQCRHYFPHALVCTSFIQDPAYAMQFKEAARLLHQVGAYLIELAQYHEAEPLYVKAIDLYERLKGAEHPDVAIVLNELAWLYRTLNDYERAETLFKQALAIRQQTLGSDHLQTAQTLSDLAWLYYNRGKYADSVAYHRRALEIRLSNLGPNHPEVATSFNNLAWLYFIEGNYEEAEAYYKRSLAIRQLMLSEDHPYLATTFDNMARLYLEQGRYKEAENYYIRSLDIRKKVLPAEHPDIAHSCTGLGQVYYAQGNYTLAEEHYLHARAIQEKVYGENHRSVAQTLTHLARLYHTLGRYDAAEDLFKKARSIRERILGVDHPDVAQTLSHLARLYYTLGRYVEAESLYERALQIRQQTLGPEHPLVAQVLDNFAQLHHALGEYSNAEALYKQALAIRENRLLTDHPDVAQILNHLADLYRIEGKYALAEDYAWQARKRWERNPGFTHPYMWRILNTLAEIYAEQGLDDRAQELFQEAWSIQLDYLGSDHPGQISVVTHLATLYCKKGEYIRSEFLLTWANELCQAKLGEQHPFRAHSLTALAEVYHAQGQDAEAERCLAQAIQICEDILGNNHPDLAASLDSLANIRRSQERYSEAEALYLRTLTIREDALGKDHLIIATTLYHLAELYYVQGQYIEAERLYRRAVAIYEQHHQFSNAEMILTMHHYADLLRKLGRDFEAAEVLRRVR